jgi:deoxyribodipyrimidine photolyase
MIPVEFQRGLLAPTVPVKLPRVLVWFRRDLRLYDNLALNAALEIAEEVVSISSSWISASRFCLLSSAVLLFISLYSC